ncbi:hypothetical protein NON00_02290 [Roseomonas sp. GC11]|uniref:hypothetical protein n=1 Tax=Roseomonas sp. GC11 TaxID=2950546 RepID=UPI0021098EDB|nr:hypothetical protein [Roseomonas sp. GC11]MCQ4158756.1 hypothetical protein [Roseomonas sp. GC11]
MSGSLDTSVTSAVLSEQPQVAGDDLDFEMELALAQQEQDKALVAQQGNRRGFFDHVKDAAGALATLPLEIPRRAVVALSDVDRGIRDAMLSGAQAVGIMSPETAQRVTQDMDVAPSIGNLARREIYQPDTVTGTITQELGTFFGGAGLLQKATGALSWATRAPTLLGRIGRGAAVGAPLDFTLTATSDDNLSAALREAGVPIPSILATDADDSGIERRLKSVAEGAGLGAIAETVLTPLTKAAVGIYRALRPVDQRIASEAAQAAPVVPPQAVQEGAEVPFERYRRGTLPGEESFPEPWQMVAERERGSINDAIDKLQGQRSYGDMQRAISNEGVREVEAAAREVALRQNILDNLTFADETFGRLRKGAEEEAAVAARETRRVQDVVEPGELAPMQEWRQAAEGRGEGWDAARATPTPDAPSPRAIQGDPGQAELSRMIAEAQAELRGAREAYETLMAKGMLTQEEREALDRAIAAATPPKPAQATQGAPGATPAGQQAVPSQTNPGAAVKASGEALPTAAPTGTAAQRMGMKLPDDVARAIQIDEAGTKEVQRLLSEGKPDDAMNLIGINPMHVQGREGITSVLNALHDVYAPAFTVANQRVKSEAVTLALADSIAATPEAARAALARTFDQTRNLDAMAVLAKRYMQSASQSVLDLSRRVAGGDTAAMGELVLAVGKAREAREYFEGTASSFGRALRSLQIDADQMLRLTPDEVAAMTAEAGGADAVLKFAKRASLLQTPEQLARVFKGTGWERFMAATSELFINNILSGPVTHAINITSNTLSALINPMRHIMGGAVTANWGAVRGGVAMYHALGESFIDHIRLLQMAAREGVQSDALGELYARKGMKPELLHGMKSFWQDSPTFSSATQVGNGALPPQAISASTFNVTNPVGAWMLDWGGKAVRLPTRLLMSSDEIMKGLNYRMDLRRQATEEGLDMLRRGELADDKALGEFIIRAMNGPSQEMDALARKYAEEATFTQKLDYNGRILDRIGSRLQGITQSVPLLRLVMPFVTTPTNILKWFVDHSIAGNALSGQFWRDAMGRNGELAQRTALGRISVGASLWGAGVYMVSTGQITGAIPQGNQGAAERATGAMPYSIRVTDKDGNSSYVPFGRFDPVSMHLGILADIAQLWTYKDAPTMQNLTTSYIMAMVDFLANKTAFKGVMDLFGTINNPLEGDTNAGEAMTRFLSNTAASMVPYSAALRQAARVVDPTSREVRVNGTDEQFPVLRQTLNRIMASTPGFSSTLPPIRDLMGNPVTVPVGWGSETTGGLLGAISPLQYRNEARSPFLQELRRLGYDMQPLVPWRTSDGVKLTPELRDRLIVLTSQDATLGGRTMQEALDALVQSSEYQRLTDDARDGTTGSKRMMLQRVVRQYKMAGEALMMQEQPEFAAMVRDARIKKRQQLIPAILGGAEPQED